MPAPSDTPNRKELTAFAKAAGSAVMVIHSDIDPKCREEVSRLLSKIGKQERLTVLVESPGGSIEDAFWISKELRFWCRKLDVGVTGWAKSATTLIALAADRVLFGKYGQLGPLDVQLYDYSGGPRRISPLEDIRGMEFLRDYYLETFQHVMNILMETLDIANAIEQAPKILAPIAAPLYQLVDHRQLGDALRNLSISEAYAQAVMIRWSPLKEDHSLVRRVAGRLVWDYPYHGYIIDLEECRRIGMTNVSEMPSDMSAICQKIIAATEPPTIAAYGENVCITNNSPSEGLENGTRNDEEK